MDAGMAHGSYMHITYAFVSTDFTAAGFDRGGGRRPLAFIRFRLASRKPKTSNLSVNDTPVQMPAHGKTRRTLKIRPVFLCIEALEVRHRHDVRLELVVHEHRLVCLLRRLAGSRLRALLHAELGDKEPIHVVHVRVESARQADARVEGLASVAGEALHAELEARTDELDIGALSERVIHDGLVFVDCDRTGGVNEVSSCL